MSSRAQQFRYFWYLTLLISVAAYEASHLMAMTKDLVFLALLIATFLTVGLTAEVSIEKGGLRCLILLLFYVAGAGIFFHTSLAENRGRLISRIQATDAKERLEKTLPSIRTRAASIRSEILADLEVLRKDLAVAQRKVNSQTVEVRRLEQATSDPASPEQPDALNSATVKTEGVAESKIELGKRTKARDSLLWQIRKIAKLRVEAESLMRGYVKRTSDAKTMERDRLHAMDRLYDLEIARGGELGTEGDPEIVPVRAAVPSLISIYRWSANHFDDNAVTPLWKALIMNILLSLFAYLVGHMAHDLRHSKQKAGPMLVPRGNGRMAA